MTIYIDRTLWRGVIATEEEATKGILYGREELEPRTEQEKEGYNALKGCL